MFNLLWLVGAVKSTNDHIHYSRRIVATYHNMARTQIYANAKVYLKFRLHNDAVHAASVVVGLGGVMRVFAASSK